MTRDSSTSACVIRDATCLDATAIAAIYAHHVLHGLGTFEEIPPDAEEMRIRLEGVLASGLPYLVAEISGRVAGFAYASRFRPRSAYRFSAEDTIYIDPRHTGRGLGRALLQAVLDRCERVGVRQMVACIGDSENHASIGLHRALGYRMAGVIPSIGFKHGRWVDIAFMWRSLGEGDATLPQSVQPTA